MVAMVINGITHTDNGVMKLSVFFNGGSFYGH